jgi:hypothetical protein
MPEPRVITFGKAFVHEWPEREYVRMLLSAFITRSGEHIVLPVEEFLWRDRKIAAGVVWALERDILHIAEERWVIDHGNVHFTCKLSFELTEQGKGFLRRSWMEMNGPWNWYAPAFTPPKEPELEWIDAWREY